MLSIYQNIYTKLIIRRSSFKVVVCVATHMEMWYLYMKIWV